MLVCVYVFVSEQLKLSVQIVKLDKIDRCIGYVLGTFLKILK